MVVIDIFLNSLFYALVGNGYLLLLMYFFNPRIWGYQDYPEKIKAKIEPQTKRERALAGLVSIPWIIIIIGFPLYSTFLLKSQQGYEIEFFLAFLNIFSMVVLFFLGDLIILDWFIISKWTPDFVIIEGSEKEDYKDFSHHYRGHAIASIPLIIVCLILAAIVSFS
ncbi:MAG: hypothetical protein ACXAC6_08510 [Candidatus Hodarchaeales archaeon]|jgi:hypothetical protein